MRISQRVHGADRFFIIDGKHYSIRHETRPRDLSPDVGFDEWSYHLPDGEHCSHPTQFGALLMILKHLGGGEWAQP